MSKYAALGNYLRDRWTDEVPMTFAEIERITGEKLPPSAHKHRPWWSNNPRNSVMTKVWLDAGFRTERVDMAGHRLVFRRARTDGSLLPAKDAGSSGGSQGGSRPPGRHPALGALKGLLQVMPGTDLTQPADPEWGERT